MLLPASLYVFITQCNKLYFQYSCHCVIQCILDISSSGFAKPVYLSNLSVRGKKKISACQWKVKETAGTVLFALWTWFMWITFYTKLLVEISDIFGLVHYSQDCLFNPRLLLSTCWSILGISLACWLDKITYLDLTKGSGKLRWPLFAHLLTFLTIK